MKGYVIEAGYMGYIPSQNRYFLFSTEVEYREVYETDINAIKEDK